MGPCLDDNTVLELVSGTLAADDHARAQQHLDSCGDCRELVGQTAPAASEWEHLQIGAELGRYRITDVIGAGAMGFVFAASDPELKRTVALKLLRASGETLRPRLLREAQALARLSHPNIVAVHDVGSFGDQLFVAMEWVDGANLSEWLGVERSLADIVAVFRQAGEGLAAAHAAGLVHRDVKPENVLVGKDGRVRVTDFGLALAIDEVHDRPASTAALPLKLTQTGAVVGTPAYISPEQLDGGSADVRSDQFSFCVALFEAVHGHRPFAGDDWPALRGAVLAGMIDRRDGRRVPRWLDRIIVRGLARDPEARWPTMHALLAALDRGALVTPRRLALGAGVLAIAGGLVAFVHAGTRVQPCAEPAEPWMWNDASTAALRDKLGDATVAATVDHAFRAYGAAWSQMTVESCMATEVHGTQSRAAFDARAQCLDDRRGYARELARALLDDTKRPRLDGALEVASSLPSIDECANTQALLALAPVVASPAARADLQARMARATVEGHLRPVIDPKTFDVLAADARALHVPALESRALLLRAYYSTDEHVEEASLQRSALAALEAHDDGALADAWARMSFHAGFHAGRYHDSEQWAAYAEAALARLGGDPVREAELLLWRGFTLIFEGRLEEARDAMARARTLFVQARGPDYWRIVLADYGEGGALLAMGRLDDALALYRRARALAARVTGTASQAYISASDNEGNALVMLGRSDEALALFATINTIDAPSSWRENQIGTALRDAKRFDEALARDRRAMELSTAEQQEGPRAAYAPLGVGLDLVELDRAREAVPILRRVVELRDGHSPPDELAQAKFALARALRASGGDAHDARELAVTARALLLPMATKYGSVFRTSLREIDAWLAT